MITTVSGVFVSAMSPSYVAILLEAFAHHEATGHTIGNGNKLHGFVHDGLEKSMVGFSCTAKMCPLIWQIPWSVFLKEIKDQIPADYAPENAKLALGMSLSDMKAIHRTCGEWGNLHGFRRLLALLPPTKEEDP